MVNFAKVKKILYNIYIKKEEKNMKKIMFLIMGLMLVGCGIEDLEIPEMIDERYVFETDDLGFVSDIAEVPTNYNEEGSYDLVNSVGEYPLTATSIFSDPGRNAYWLTVYNRRGEAFNYIYKKLDGLSANTNYKGMLTVTGMTPYAADTMDIANSSIESVFIKAGIISTEPVPTIDEDNYYRITTFDKGSQSDSGADLAVAGTLVDNQIAIDGTDYFEVIYFVNLDFTTDADGNAYIVVGYDSGFKGLNIFGITEIAYFLDQTGINKE